MCKVTTAARPATASAVLVRCLVGCLQLFASVHAADTVLSDHPAVGVFGAWLGRHDPAALMLADAPALLRGAPPIGFAAGELAALAAAGGLARTVRHHTDVTPHAPLTTLAAVHEELRLGTSISTERHFGPPVCLTFPFLSTPDPPPQAPPFHVNCLVPTLGGC